MTKLTKISRRNAMRSQLQAKVRVKGRAPGGRASVVLGALFGVVLGISPLVAGTLKIQFPPETASFKPGPGSEIANAQCLTCHSVDYVVTQPPLPRVLWASEIKKMREKFGAPIPEEATEPLAVYLTANYGVLTKGEASIPPGTNYLAVGANLQAMSVETFASVYGCLNCHKVNTKVVGPAFVDVAAKYRNDPGALDKIAQQIHNGGSGKWGSAVMPPFPFVTDVQANALGKWIMGREASGR